MISRFFSTIGLIGSWVAVTFATPQDTPPIATFSAPTQTLPMRVEVTPLVPSAEGSSLPTTEPTPAGLRPIVAESAITDASVMPVSYEAAIPVSAAEQMVQLVELRPGGEAGAVPLSLRDALRASPLDQRLAITRAYWRCFEARAQVESARFIESQVQQLSRASGLETSLLPGEKALANATRLEAEATLREAQTQLLRMLPQRPDRALPLPVSPPLVSEYMTNYETLAARRPPDPRLQGIDQRLVEGLMNLTALADAAWQNRETLTRFIAGFNRQEIGLAEAMHAIGVCRRTHDAFYRAVAVYNQDIASYAFAVAPPGLPADQAVTMLIKVPSEPRQAEATSVLNSGTAPIAIPNSNAGSLAIDSRFGNPAGLPPISTGSSTNASMESGSRPPAMSSNANFNAGSLRTSPPATSPSAANPVDRGTASTNSFPQNSSGNNPPIVNTPGTNLNSGSTAPPMFNSNTSGTSSPPPTQFQLGSPNSVPKSPPSSSSGSQSLGNHRL